MNKLFKMFLLVAPMIALWCYAENFLATEKPVQRKTPGHLKQEIIEEMGMLLENQAALIEIDAHIQRMLCRHVRAIAEQDKASYFKTASVQDLQQIVSMLTQENERSKKEYASKSKLLESLKFYKGK